jgi:hypothetical protein
VDVSCTLPAVEQECTFVVFTFVLVYLLKSVRSVGLNGIGLGELTSNLCAVAGKLKC